MDAGRTVEEGSFNLQQRMKIMVDMLRKIKGEKSELTHTPVGGSVNYWLLTAKNRVFSSRVGGHKAATVQLAAGQEEN